MECKRCGNKDISYFYKGHKGYYCRKCIRFSRILLEEEINETEYDISPGSEDYHFSYQLTKPQLDASKMCLEYSKEYDVLLNCVCGSGKSEIVVESISNYLKHGKKVAYAISRKEVVKELGIRFKNIFSNAKVVVVYGGHHNEITGDLIVCTAHQLYRYYHTFDLLILDEVDAFPLKGNETLMNIAINSCKGRIIYSTATTDESLMMIINKRPYRKVELNVRPSFRPLAIPRVIVLSRIIGYIYLYFLMKKIEGQCIIFVSNKKDCEYLYRIFRHFYSCTYVYSDLGQRDNNIRQFRDKKYQFIFSTTVLERGITISNINIIILHYLEIFDEANLIQMLGRIGRGISDDKGKGYIIAQRYYRSIRNTIKYLERANSYL